jgi:hypothetical protein
MPSSGLWPVGIYLESFIINGKNTSGINDKWKAESGKLVLNS